MTAAVELQIEQVDETPISEEERAARVAERAARVPVGRREPVESAGGALLRIAAQWGAPRGFAAELEAARREAQQRTARLCADREAGILPQAVSLHREDPEDVRVRRQLADAARRSRRERSAATLRDRMPQRFARPFRWEDQHAPAHRWAARPESTLLLSSDSVGTGKSHLAWTIAGALADAGRWVVGWSMPGLNEALRPGGDVHALDDAMSCDVLLVDEAGAERVSEWTLEQWFMIVDARWANLRPTIVSTNLDVPQLVARYGERIVDRLLDEATIVRLAGGSRRG